MRFPVHVRGMEGRVVEVVTSQWTGGVQLLVNGTPAQKGQKRGEFFITRPDGQRTVIQFIPKFALDNAIRITVDGEPQVLGNPLTVPEIVFVWLPMILMFVGGMIGGLCAGVAIPLNLALFRSTCAAWIKYVGAIAIATCALLLYLAISIPLYRYMHPTGSNTQPQSRERIGAEDVALSTKGAQATSDSELSREPGCTPKVIDGILATPGDFSNRWHSSIDTPHPHWVQVKLLHPVTVTRVVIYFADPQGVATSFEGVAYVNGQKKRLFNVEANQSGQSYTANITPTLIDTFRLIIRKSANPAYPNAAQVSEIALYPPTNP